MSDCIKDITPYDKVNYEYLVFLFFEDKPKIQEQIHDVEKHKDYPQFDKERWRFSAFENTVTGVCIC